ncbi:MAG: chemotaxis protein CheW [candidate division Zixibacteria bacterium]|nr:chemotaxis protein CheW [candidate division Zixibacteria bacterium]
MTAQGHSAAIGQTATADSQAAANAVHLVCFLLGDEELAVPVDRVIEVVRGTDLNPIVDNTRYLAGMLPYRTETIPVVDLRQWLNVPPSDVDVVSRVVVVSQGTKLIGLAVDDVTQVLRGDRRFWQEPSGDSPRQRFLAGYYTEDERRIPILECDHLPGI